MPANKLRIQITQVSGGDTLKFIRNATDGHVTLCKNRKLYVIDVKNGYAKVAFTSPIADSCGRTDDTKTFESDGFKYCRYLPTSLLIRNCREVK